MQDCYFSVFYHPCVLKLFAGLLSENNVKLNNIPAHVLIINNKKRGFIMNIELLVKAFEIVLSNKYNREVTITYKKKEILKNA